MDEATQWPRSSGLPGRGAARTARGRCRSGGGCGAGEGEAASPRTEGTGRTRRAAASANEAVRRGATVIGADDRGPEGSEGGRRRRRTTRAAGRPPRAGPSPPRTRRPGRAPGRLLSRWRGRRRCRRGRVGQGAGEKGRVRGSRRPLRARPRNGFRDDVASAEEAVRTAFGHVTLDEAADEGKGSGGRRREELPDHMSAEWVSSGQWGSLGKQAHPTRCPGRNGSERAYKDGFLTEIAGWII